MDQSFILDCRKNYSKLLLFYLTYLVVSIYIYIYILSSIF